MRLKFDSVFEFKLLIDCFSVLRSNFVWSDLRSDLNSLYSKLIYLDLITSLFADYSFESLLTLITLLTQSVWLGPEECGYRLSDGLSDKIRLVLGLCSSVSFD